MATWRAHKKSPHFQAHEGLLPPGGRPWSFLCMGRGVPRCLRGGASWSRIVLRIVLVCTPKHLGHAYRISPSAGFGRGDRLAARGLSLMRAMRGILVVLFA